jgi:hypothetical protein
LKANSHPLGGLPLRVVDCRHCGKQFATRVMKATFCSGACRTQHHKRAQQERKRAAPRPAPSPPAAVALSTEDLATIIRRELRALAVQPAAPSRAPEDKTLTRLADAQEQLRDLFRRGLVDLKRHAGLVEEPVAPRVSRRRP